MAEKPSSNNFDGRNGKKERRGRRKNLNSAHERKCNGTPIHPVPTPILSPCMTNEVARDILESLISSSCCYRNDPATQLTIDQISKLSVFLYKLETFIEKRSGNWKTVPYGGPQSNFSSGGPGNGKEAPPHMWKFKIAPSARFVKGQRVMELPNTASITRCPRCQGSGKTQCSSCGGSGSIPCDSCFGMGHTTRRNHVTNRNELTRCEFCYGRGRCDCDQCGRRGVQTCATCEGNFRVKTYFEMQVDWNCTSEKCLVIDGDLNSGYQKYFKREKGRVVIPGHCSTTPQPLDSFPDEGVQEASRHLIRTSVSQNQTPGFERIIEFRQTVTEILGTRVWFTWKNKDRVALISGNDNSVHFPNPYHQLCSIL